VQKSIRFDNQATSATLLYTDPKVAGEHVKNKYHSA